MENIWAPWRMDYILNDKENGCIFCDKAKENKDERNLILLRKNLCFVIMNLYPYNNGHIMIAPYRHIGNVTETNKEESLEIFETMQICLKILEKTFKPDGFNVGINLGKVAGAGIKDHVHLHIVPRWEGDTNFMPVLADVRVIPEHISKTYKTLKEKFISCKL